MDLKAVIFDFGGVLVRTEDQTHRENLAKELGMSYTDIEQLVFSSPSARKAARGLVSAKEHWEDLGRTLNLSVDQLKDFRARFFAGDRLDEDLINYLRSLHNRYQIALLSNAWDDLRTYLEDVWHITDVFDQIVISAEVSIIKPEHQIYTLLLDRLGISPPQALFVDDFIENIEAARQVGLVTIHFDERERVLRELHHLFR
jgi:epoxide hydrolase-like predicted phosphatase